MKSSRPATLDGRIVHPVYSPRGDIEGVLIACDGAEDEVQIVFARDDAEAEAAFLDARPGQAVKLRADPVPASPKGAAAHPVLELRELLSIDGRPYARDGEAMPYRGRVRRFNYARHGAINGVVLDSGDFLHLKPEGHERIGLRIGDEVIAEGDAQRLADGSGWAVEARAVNGKAVRGKG